METSEEIFHFDVGLFPLQSDEDEDNYDEVRSTIEQSIIKERLSRLARLQLNPERLPQSSEGAEEEGQAAAVMEVLNCEAIHKKFNLTSCYLCKQGNGEDKREERKKSNMPTTSLLFFVVPEDIHTISMEGISFKTSYPSGISNRGGRGVGSVLLQGYGHFLEQIMLFFYFFFISFAYYMIQKNKGISI